MSDLEKSENEDFEPEMPAEFRELIDGSDEQTAKEMAAEEEVDADAKKVREAKGIDDAPAPKAKKATAPALDKALAPATATKAHLDAAMAEMEQAHRAGLHATVGKIALRISDEHAEGGESLYRQCGKVTDRKGKSVKINSFEKYAEHIICRQLGFDLATLKRWMSDARGSVQPQEPIAPVGAKPVPTEADLDAALIDFEVSCLGWGARDYCDEEREAALMRKSANIVWWLDKHEVWKVGRDKEGNQRFASLKECIEPSSFSYCIQKKTIKEWIALADPVEADERPLGRTDGYPDLPVHEEADKFPMLKDPELNALADDVRENGLHEPIDVYRGEIIDGRNRYASCRIAGVKPRFREFEDVERKGEGPDPTPAAVVAYIASKNIHRRHLNTQERTLRAAALAKAKQLTQEKAAEQFKISRRNLVRAKGIYDRGSKRLIAAVEACDVTIFNAERVIDLPPEKQDELLEDVRAGRAATLWEARDLRYPEEEEENAGEDEISGDDLDEDGDEEPARPTPDEQTAARDAASAKQVAQGKQDLEDFERRKRERIEASDREEAARKKRVTVQFETDGEAIEPTLEHRDEHGDTYRLYACRQGWVGGIETVTFADGGQRLIPRNEESFEERREWFESKVAGTRNKSE